MNDHQVSFSNAVAKRTGTIIVVDDMDKLGATITNYNEIINGINRGLKSNNILFNKELEKIVNEMFEGRK